MRTAHGLELSCWLGAAALALALLLVPPPNTRTGAQAIGATAAPLAPHLVIYQQHCIERIVARTGGKSDDYVAALINQLCIAPLGRLTSAAGQALPSCDRLVTMRLVPVTKPVGGCLGG